MKHTHIVLLAAILVIAAFVAPAMAGSIVPIYVDPGTGTGQLYVQLACHNNLISKYVVVQRVDAGILVYGNGDRVDAGLVSLLKLLGENETYSFRGDGEFDTGLAPGTFLITLPDGNGGQPEYALADVKLNEETYVRFFGHAGGSTDTPVCKITIISAEYSGVTIPAVTHIVHHPYTPAWTEYLGDYARYGMMYVYVGAGHGDYSRVGSHYNYVGHVYHPAVPAWDEMVVDTPAITGGSVDVTSAVQGVVDAGYRAFIFDNGLSPGGIWDITSTISLAEITDPAPGIVKQVEIVYDLGCGAPAKTVTVDEYEVIKLG